MHSSYLNWIKKIQIGCTWNIFAMQCDLISNNLTKQYTNKTKTLTIKNSCLYKKYAITLKHWTK